MSAVAEAAWKAKGEASWKAHEWEARDAHGRWVHGWAGLKKAVDGLLASGKIDKAQHSALMKAASRHATMGRGIPKGAQEDHGKMLSFLASTLRQDSLDERGKKNISESKFLSRTARSVENVHAVVTGKPRTGSFPAIKHPPVHPDDVGGAPSAKVVSKPEPKVVSKAPPVKPVSEPKVVQKAPEATTLPDRKTLTASIRNLKEGESMDVPGGTMRYSNSGYTFTGHDGTKKRYGPATRAAREVLRMAGGGSTPKASEPVEAEHVTAVAKKVSAPAKAVAKVKDAFSNLKGPKVVKKVQTVKVSGENIKVGDVIDLGKAKIPTGETEESIYTSSGTKNVHKLVPHQRTVLDTQRTGDQITLTLSPPLDEDLRNASYAYMAKTKKSYGNAKVETGETQAHIGAKSVQAVKREVEVTKAMGTKVTLDKAPTTKEFKAALDDALQNASSPEDIAHLDPSHRPMPKGHSAGHAQQLMYDLAVGKLNGVNRSAKVKSDDEYRFELSGITTPVPDAETEKHMEQVAKLQGSAGGADQNFRDAWKEMKAGYAGEPLSAIADKMFTQAASTKGLTSGIEYGDHGYYHVTKANADLMRSDFQRQQDKYIEDHGLRTNGPLDDVRAAAEAQTPYVFPVARRNYSLPGAVSYGMAEPEWKDGFKGDYPTVSGSGDYARLVQKNTVPGETVHVAPSSIGEEQLGMYHFASGRSTGLVGQHRADWHEAHPDATFHDYVNSPEFRQLWQEQGAGTQNSTIDNAQKTIGRTRALDAKARGDAEEQRMIDERRGLEGTVKFDSGLPTWDEDGKLESQSWKDVTDRSKGVTLAGKPLEQRHYQGALDTAEVPGPDGDGGTMGYSTLDGEEDAQILAMRADNLMEMNPELSRSEAMHQAIDETGRPTGGVVKPSSGKPLKLEPEQIASLHAAVTNMEEAWKRSNPDTTYRDYVPTFHTQGMVEDGVLYHRQEDGRLDPEKLKQTLTQSLRVAAKSVEGQTEEHPLTNAELRQAVEGTGVNLHPGLRGSLGVLDSPSYDNQTVTGSESDLHAMIDAYKSVNLSSEDATKLHDVVSGVFKGAEGRTRAKTLPRVDVDTLVRLATSSDDGLDAARKHLDSLNHSVYNGKSLAPVQYDELKKGMDIVERGMQKSSIPTTTGSVTQEADLQIRKALENAGAVKTVNSKAMHGKGTWTELKPGDMYLISEGGQGLSEEEQVAQTLAAQPALMSPGYNGTNEYILTAANAMKQASQDWKEATTTAGLHDAAQRHTQATQMLMDAYKALAEKPETHSYYAKQHLRTMRSVKKNYGSQGAAGEGALQNAASHRTGADKSIEYVPWSQGGAGSANGAAPRSQRGRLTLEGYTPEEATAKLKELGVVGDLESHTPANAIFRSSRRIGDIAPLHPAYVRGEAPVPDLPYLMTHGLTDGKAGNAVASFQGITNTGGLMSIADRFKRGIKTSTSSPVGDIGSGIDHVVFLGMDGGSTCGSSSPVRIGMRPDVTMRRDVLVSPVDFGGGKDRYPHYKNYRDKLEAQAGLEVGKSTIWTPLDPKARQVHINDQAVNPGSAEYDVAHQIRVEDMQVVAVRDQPTLTQVQQHLDKLMSDGVVTRIPKVILQTEWDKNIKLK